MAGGMPLAFTQEDFLVCNDNDLVIITVNIMLEVYKKCTYKTGTKHFTCSNSVHRQLQLEQKIVISFQNVWRWTVLNESDIWWALWKCNVRFILSGGDDLEISRSRSESSVLVSNSNVLRQKTNWANIIHDRFYKLKLIYTEGQRTSYFSFARFFFCIFISFLKIETNLASPVKSPFRVISTPSSFDEMYEVSTYLRSFPFNSGDFVTGMGIEKCFVVCRELRIRKQCVTLFCSLL